MDQLQKSRSTQIIRTFTLEVEGRAAGDAIPVVLSSDAVVDVSDGPEILVHSRDAIDLQRAPLPIIATHKGGQVNVGVIDDLAIAGGRLRGMARFGSRPEAAGYREDVQNRIIRSVSVGYARLKSKPRADGVLVTSRWMPTHAALVAEPADTNAGFFRSTTSRNSRKTTMENDNDDTVIEQQRGSRSQRANGAAEAERGRMIEIQSMGKRYSLPQNVIDSMQRDGTSVDDARARVMEHQRTQSRREVPVSGGYSVGAEIGMNDGEIGNFSLCRAIRATISGDWQDAGLEREASRSVATRLGRSSQGFFVPAEVMARSAWLQQRATYQVGTPGQGGNLVQTDLAVDYFTEALRNTSQVIGSGAMMLTGLVGNVDISRRTSVTGTYWVAESGGLTESEATFDHISLRPKTIGALSKMSRLALMQTTPTIEQLTRYDMIQQIGLGIDLAALSGPGTGNQPTGIAATGSIGAVVGGTNGAAVTLDNIIDLETALSSSNAPPETRAYLLNGKTIGALKKLKSSTGQYLWTTDAPGQRSGTPASINGNAMRPTNQLRSTLTKGTSSGVCSELIFGAWSELIIGQWGVLEIVPNPYDSTGFAAGDVLIRAMQTVDIQVRHAASFAMMGDALTS